MEAGTIAWWMILFNGGPMGLGGLAITFVGGFALFALSSYGVHAGARMLGFQQGDTLIALAMVGACLVLLVLWPFFYLLRRIRYRGKPMPPIHPEVVLPRWLVVGTKLIVAMTVSVVSFVFVACLVVHGALVGWTRIESDLTPLVTVRFLPVEDEVLASHDLELLSPSGELERIEGAVAEAWIISGRVFLVDDWLRGVADRFSVGPAIRMSTLSYSAEADTPVIRHGELVGRSLLEDVLDWATAFIPGVLVMTIDSPPMVPARQGLHFQVSFDQERVQLIHDGVDLKDDEDVGTDADDEDDENDANDSMMDDEWDFLDDENEEQS